MGADAADHVFLQPARRLADDLFGHGELLERHLVHERVRVAIAVQVLVLVVVELGPFDGLAGTIALVLLDPVEDSLHLDLHKSPTLARGDDLGLDDHEQFAVDFDDVAGTQRIGLDLHFLIPSWLGLGPDFRARLLIRATKGPQCLAYRPPGGIPNAMPPAGRC
jgi:hypothetical protein